MGFNSDQEKSFPTIKELSELCFDKFSKLPKTGKPTAKEWTVFSAIVQFNSKTKESAVVAIGCGTKCLGKSQLCQKGLALNDSHGEVIARRAFLRYLYFHFISYDKENKDANILEFNEESQKFNVKDEFSFHFVTTQTPCGDACIIEEVEPKAKKAKLETNNEEGEDEEAKEKAEEKKEIIYTGAKLIGNKIKDAMQQDVGAIRTKPGRGDRTLSVSCSDKLAKWNILGVQGALIDLFLRDPIYFATMNFCCDSNRESLERAIYKRWSNQKFLSKRFVPQTPIIRIDSSITFEYQESKERYNPSANSIAWCNIDESEKCFDAMVRGKKLGITKRASNTAKAACIVSKFCLRDQFLEVLQLYPVFRKQIRLEKDVRTFSYWELKNLAEDYQNAWLDLKENIFQQWCEKPKNLLEFKSFKDS